jgi:hypothetical protein
VSPRRTALLGAVALLVVGELVARLQGDRLCSDRAGVVYERSTALGWRHVSDLSGWLGTCDGDGVPPTPVETDPTGRCATSPSRSSSPPPGMAGSITKILGYAGYPPRAWRKLLLCALFNAVAVAAVHLLDRRRGTARTPGALGSAWRIAATAIFVLLAWLPMMLPLWNCR